MKIKTLEDYRLGPFPASTEYCASLGHRFIKVIQCMNELDIVQCPNCGSEQVSKCNFDEEFS